MAGLRYTDWRHLRVIGSDIEAAQPYLGEAKKLLGAVWEEAARYRLGTFTLRRELSDGTVIIAEKHGDIPRMTIAPAPRAEAPLRVPPKDAFVVWARDAAHVDGIDTDHPQQILRPAWQTFFFDAQIAGYDDFPGKKGTYRTNADGRVVFPDGVRHAGNVDWRGPDGERLSWTGPSTRYWFDPYIQPRSQYGKHVFLLGQVLLDVEAYIADSTPDAPFAERYVLGAALGDNALIVMLADLPIGDTPTGTVPPNTVIAPSPWPLDTVPLTLCRFALRVESDAEDLMRLRAVARSREVMWSGALPRALNPWHFDAAGRRAVSVGLPESATAGYSHLTPGTGLASAPSPNSEVYQLAIDADGAATLTTRTVQLPPVGEAVLAADFAGAQLRQLIARRGPIENTADAFALILDDAELPLISERDLAGATQQAVVLRSLLYADLRQAVLVMLVIEFTVAFPDVTTSDVRVEIIKAGAVLRRVPLALEDVQGCGLSRSLASVDRRWRECTREVAVSPQFALYGMVGGSEPPVTFFLRWTGAHGLYSFRPYPDAAVFSAYAVRATTPGPLLPITNLSDAGFESDRADVDGHTSVLGCTASDQRVLLSCYGYRSKSGRSLHAVAGSDADTDLPTLTGVGGTNARFHPIWQLGELPAVLAA